MNKITVSLTFTIWFIFNLFIGSIICQATTYIQILWVWLTLGFIYLVIYTLEKKV